MIKEMVKKGHQVFDKPATKVEIMDKRIEQIIKDMIDTISNEPIPGRKAVGLSTTNIGYDKRIILLNYPNRKLMINPEIIYEEGEQITTEGCGSLDENTLYKLKRPYIIKVKYSSIWTMDTTMDILEYEATGIEAWVICHEIDHLTEYLLMIKHLR